MCSKRRLKSYKFDSGVNSLWYWHRVKNPIRVVLNFLVIYICRFLPSLKLKNLLYRCIGIKVGRNVAIGLGAMFDIFFPELIEIGENSIIGYNSVLLAHEFLIKELRVGEVKIGRNVLISANVTILPGIEIGDGAVVSAMSLVNEDLPPNCFAGGVPAREIKR
jgi:acetyltransferase-like isoleucine patch superfamily enzyme